MEAPSAQLTALAAQLHGRLRERGQTLATVESLTGGLVGAVLTAVPGASESYRGGLVVYATDLKSLLAGVPSDLLAERGPVDPDVAVAMAADARERLGVDWAVSLTGVAGPDGQDGKPPGLVYVAVAGPDGASAVEHRLAGGRAAVREAACEVALHAVYTRLAEGE